MERQKKGSQKVVKISPVCSIVRPEIGKTFCRSFFLFLRGVRVFWQAPICIPSPLPCSLSSLHLDQIDGCSQCLVLALSLSRDNKLISGATERKTGSGAKRYGKGWQKTEAIVFLLPFLFPFTSNVIPSRKDAAAIGGKSGRCRYFSHFLSSSLTIVRSLKILAIIAMKLKLDNTIGEKAGKRSFPILSLWSWPSLSPLQARKDFSSLFPILLLTNAQRDIGMRQKRGPTAKWAFFLFLQQGFSFFQRVKI